MALRKCKKCGKVAEATEKFCPDCGGKVKEKNIFMFFLKMVLLFIIVDLISQIVPALLTTSILNYKYGDMFLAETVWCVIVIIVMLLSGNSYVFTEKKEGFFKSIILGAPMLFIAVACFFSSIASLDGIYIGNLINLALLCLAIGLTEEFLCRGWIQNEFIERFGRNRKQVILSIILASLVFGIMHITNIGAGQTVFETILQIIQATAAGTLLGSIYYRTKNIWSVVFIHGIYDFALMLEEVNSLKDCTTGTVTTNIFLYNIYGTILVIALYIIATILVLRKTKINKLVEEKERITMKDRKEERKKTVVLWVILAVVMFLNFVPIEIEGYDDYFICYTYNERLVEEYEFHYPVHDKLKFSYEKTDENMLTTKYNFEVGFNGDGVLNITNLNTKEKIILENYEYIYNFQVIENPNNFIIIFEDYGYESKLYYSKVPKANISDDKEFLNKLKDSFKLYEVPNMTEMGYITVPNVDYKYPAFKAYSGHYFYIDEKDNLYMINN